MKKTFAIFFSPGPAWIAGKTSREQPYWAEHAAFMDKLFEDGTVIREAVGVVRARQRYVSHLQLHVSACPRRRSAMPIMYLFSRCLRRGRPAHHAARQSGGGSEGRATAHPCPCQSARLAVAALVLLGWQHLQPRLLRRVGGRSPDADAQRVPARRRSDPSLLGLGASLHPARSWTGSSPHRFHRPTVESLRLHAPRTRERLVSGVELLLMVVGSARARRLSRSHRERMSPLTQMC